MVNDSLVPISPSHFSDIFMKVGLSGGCYWQKDNVNKKVLNEILGLEFFTETDLIKIECKNKIIIFEDDFIFIKLNYRNIIFRLHPGDYYIEDQFIIATKPKEMFGLEKRPGGDRILMQRQLDVSVSIKRMEQYFGELTFELELRVIDISEQGVGVIVSKLNKHILKLKDRFLISSIDNRPLKRPISGIICYMNSRGQGLKRGDVRLGLKLNSPLDPETFAILKKKGQRILFA